MIRFLFRKFFMPTTYPIGMIEVTFEKILGGRVIQWEQKNLEPGDCLTVPWMTALDVRAKDGWVMADE